MYTATITASTIILSVNGQDVSVAINAPQAAALLAELTRPHPDEAKLLKLASMRESLAMYTGKDCTIENDGAVYRQGIKLPKVLAQKVVDCFRDKVPYEYLLAFFDKLNNNPSQRAVEESYTFLEHMGMPITPHGTFLAYKAVRSDYLDKWTGKFDNTPGKPCIEMPRNKVCDNPDVGCSVGFHVGSLEYATSYANSDDKIVLVEVDPSDIVSVPTDCNFQKLRTCKYRVVCDAAGKLNDSAVETTNDPYTSAFKETLDWMADNLPPVRVTLVMFQPPAEEAKVEHKPKDRPPELKTTQAYKHGLKRAKQYKSSGIKIHVDTFFKEPRRRRYLRERYGNTANAYIVGFKEGIA